MTIEADNYSDEGDQLARIKARVQADALKQFAEDASEAEISELVSNALANLRVDSVRVAQFIPLLALRDVREVLRSRSHLRR